MRLGLVLRALSVIVGVVSLAMALPLCLALIDGSGDAGGFALSMACGLILGLLLSLGGKDRERGGALGVREGVGVTGLAWILASAVGAMPYWSSGVTPQYVDAFFETMSGFTTTGATVLTDIEAVSRALLLWRALTHWMGGMGIIVLSLAVLPFLGVGGMELYKAEVPGVTAEKLAPRLQETALLLWGAYVVMTLAETVLLMLCGMSLFDAFAHSCATVATGGFSTRSASLAAFPSPWAQWIVTVFMFLSGVNFSLYFLLGRMCARDFFANEELRAYALIVVGATAAMMASLAGAGMASGIEPTLRRCAFHVVSVMTTTGFVAEDYGAWPALALGLFVLLMFVGACGGSTGGGCKVARFLLVARLLRAEALRLLHPKAVSIARMDGRPISRSTMGSAVSFFVLYVLLLTAGTLLAAASAHPRLGLLESFTGALTCLSNVGPGLGALGPVESFAWLPTGVKWLFSFLMLAGRLELFAVVLLFLPSTWSR